MHVLNSTKEFECFAGKRAEYYLNHLSKNTTCGYEDDNKRSFTGITIFPPEDEVISIYHRNLFGLNNTNIQVLVDNAADAPLYIDLRSELVYTPNDAEFIWMIATGAFALLMIIVLSVIGCNICLHMKKIRDLETRGVGSIAQPYEPMGFESPGHQRKDAPKNVFNRVQKRSFTAGMDAESDNKTATFNSHADKMESLKTLKSIGGALLDGRKEKFQAVRFDMPDNASIDQDEDDEDGLDFTLAKNSPRISRTVDLNKKEKTNVPKNDIRDSMSFGANRISEAVDNSMEAESIIRVESDG